MSESGRDTIPCGHLVEASPPGCLRGYRVPQDCATCRHYAPGIDEQERTRCEVWTRVMGYHRPVSAFNAGKQAEHVQRRYFREPVSQTPGGAGDDC